MEDIIPLKIQITCIAVSVSFLFYIGYLIIKGKLREEYAIFWVVSTIMLIAFSFWRNGLAVVAEFFGVFSPPNVVFMGAIFGIFIYLLHLSVVVSKLQETNKKLSQEIALLKNKINKKNSEPISEK
ncbi:MAG TPA: DUF2304 domain-containing protein [Bacteroidales bacterium]|nr:DUF2304 domain-containing protein [Bacteroidales bacterium]HPS16108.1 DUF2304 domain-containing protein [Bacteroidales bacterium]